MNIKRKWIIALTLTAAVLSGGRAAAASSLVVNGAAVETAGTYVYEDTTYVSLRVLAQALRPDAEILWEDGQALVQAGDLSLSAQPGECYIEANGRALYVPGGVHMEEGRTSVPVRVLAEAMDAQVEWEEDTGTVTVTGGGAITPAGLYYDEEDLYWLSRIISAESRGEPLLGQVAVGNVILNRVASPEFPDSIYEVIFDQRWGGQFEPVRSGAIYEEPALSSVLAAKLCLEGANAAGDSLYFLAPALAGNFWIMEERTHVTTIGSHWFYR